MLFHVERAWIEEAANTTLSWYGKRHEFSKNVSQDGQENHRHVNCLRLEVEDFLEDRSKASEAKACANCVSQVFLKWEQTRAIAD